VGVLLLPGGGSATVPTGYGIVAFEGNSPGTVTGGDGGPGGTEILSGFGGLSYAGSAASIIATGGTNSITATVGGTYPAQFVDVGGTSTVTAVDALVMTEGGSTSVNASSGNFVVTSGSDTVTTGAGNNTVGAIGSVGGITYAGAGDLLFMTGGTLGAAGVQTIIGGTGNETVFAGPKSIDWIGSNPGGSLIFIGGASASTVVGGAGQETLFGGTGGDVYDMGSSNGNVVVGSAGSLSVVGGTGSTAIFGNAGSNITYTGASTLPGATLVVGNGSETVNAGGSQANAFLLVGNGDATVTASNAGGDLLRVFNQGTAGIAHTITLTDFIASGIGQNFQFVGYGFNPTNLADNATIVGPTQQIIGGSDVITLSDNTKIVLTGITSPVTFSHFNAIS
jgi:Ca2+-binding RTX toxin-like protein